MEILLQYSKYLGARGGGGGPGWNLNKRVADCKKLSSEGKAVIINLDYNHTRSYQFISHEREIVVLRLRFKSELYKSKYRVLLQFIK